MTISRWQSRDQSSSGQINQHPVQILAYLLFLIYICIWSDVVWFWYLRERVKGTCALETHESHWCASVIYRHFSRVKRLPLASLGPRDAGTHRRAQESVAMKAMKCQETRGVFVLTRLLLFKSRALFVRHKSVEQKRVGWVRECIHFGMIYSSLRRSKPMWLSFSLVEHKRRDRAMYMLLFSTPTETIIYSVFKWFNKINEKKISVITANCSEVGHSSHATHLHWQTCRWCCRLSLERPRFICDRSAALTPTHDQNTSCASQIFPPRFVMIEAGHLNDVLIERSCEDIF